MQACPYDALYIDPDTHTAAKCHFCAHRVERNLEPACVIVCPERAILAGDLDDPGSEVARVLAREHVLVRKPEQGTRPKLFYVGADAATLTPQVQRPAAATLWGQRPPVADDVDGGPMPGLPRTPKAVEVLGRTVYDVPHEPRPWGWRVSAYLWTKSVAAGAALVAALGVLAGWPVGTGLTLPVVALVFLLATTVLLITDLKRPDRFHFILLKANYRSWLVWGAWILMAFGAVLGLWLLSAGLGRGGLRAVLAPPLILLALAAAGYSAFLFAQAEGRDAWQSPLLLPHLLVSALTAGAAVSLFLHGATPALRGLLLASLGVNLLLAVAERVTPHPNADAAAAARLITDGPWRTAFWGGAVVAGTLLPSALLLVPGQLPAALAALLALLGLYYYDDCWVKAGQAVPLS
jgi:formate-dependent nitrite reductase membrane component NrfD